MKRFSIKMRVTLWFTMLMLILVLAVLGFMLTISSGVTERETRNRLLQTVADNAEELDVEDTVVDIDDDFDMFRNGVYSLVYSNEGRLLHGQQPRHFPAEPLQDGDARVTTVDGRRFYVYDMPFNKADTTLWVRGIAEIDSGAGTTANVIRTAFITLPFLVLLAALGGYFIARQSFRPIDKIIQAAEEIGSGKDLSRRIQLGQGRDEIHRLAQTFNSMFARLEHSFEAERQFTSDASHELRTPTSVILAQCDYALSSGGSREELGEAIKVIQRQSQKMSRLISGLLSLSRMEKNPETMDIEELDLSELLESLCADLPNPGEKGITIKTDIQPNILAHMDRMMMMRIATNLINNAYQYGRENGHIEVKLVVEEDEIRFSVSDDGIGIAAGEQEKIWHRLYQVDAVRGSRSSGSMGLGLAMVKQIAELHGGRTELTSNLGEGSCFTIIFPNKN